MDPLLLGFIAGLAAQVASDYALARWHTIPRLRALVYADAARLLDEKLPKPPAAPGAMRGDMDPADLNDRKAAKAAKRARTEVAVLAELGSRFGPIKSKMVWDWLGAETQGRVIGAADRWSYVLEPLIAKLPPTLHVDNDATKEPPVAMQTE